MMINQGQEYIFSAWWYGVFPGLTIMLVVLALNFVGMRCGMRWR